MEEMVHLHVTLINKKTQKPLQGEEYVVKFYDKDLISDDYLGQSDVDDVGHAFIQVTRNNYRSKDSPFEKYPDVYFILYKNNEIIYESPVSKNLKLNEIWSFPASEGFHCDLGKFMV